MEYVAEAIRRVIRPEVVRKWMCRPVPALDGRTPAELVQEGRYEEIAKLMRSIDQGAEG